MQPNLKFTVLFPSFEHSRREPDTMFHREVAALETLGIPYRVFEVESFVEGDIKRAFEFFGEPGEGLMLYRGYILKVNEYHILTREMTKRGYHMLSSSSEYHTVNHLPQYFPLIENQAIPAVWTPDTSTTAVMTTALKLGSPPWFIKDYVKSAKELGLHSCIIPDVKPPALEKRVKYAVQQLLDYRGRWFEGGIVIRPLIALNYIEESPFGGPTYEEYRLFFFNGKLISVAACGWCEGSLSSVADFETFGDLIPSPFFTLDVVVTQDGEVLILEMGDGGVSQLPRQVDAVDFYTQIISLSFEKK